MESRPPVPSGELGRLSTPAEAYSSKGKQRSRTGCRTCRSRKVKCDERPGGCLNCARLNLSCPNARDHAQTNDLSDDAAQTQAGLKRLRTFRSCQACRSSKTRCSGDRPTCARCQQRDAECVYDGKQAPAWVQTVSSDVDESHEGLLNAGSASQILELNRNSLPSKRPSSHVSDLSEDPTNPPSAAESSENYCPIDFAWLVSPELPGKDKIVILVEEFFARMHHLRCFGFIHKPSYLQQLDEQPRKIQQGNTLLHAICALGAKFYALKSAEHLKLPEDFALRTDLRLGVLVVESYPLVSQAIILLHEHDLRVGDYASAFMLTGLAVRMAQALQINLEKSCHILASNDQLQWSHREARRRLMWSVYTMDSGAYLPFLSTEDRTKGPVDTLDLQAQFIRLLSLRRKVLRYVKHLDTALPPWLRGSDFAQLESALFSWYEELPGNLQFTQTAIYMRKESSQLGALLLLHWTYHQSLCDLNRIGMRDLFQIRKAINFPPDQSDFQKRTQDRCNEHATAIALMFAEASKHGHACFADTWLPVIAHDSTRVIVHYITHKLGTSTHKLAMVRPHSISCMQANIIALKKMVPMFQLAKPLQMKCESNPKLADLVVNISNRSTSLEAPTQFTPEYILNPLAIYRMARRDIDDREKYAPERASSPSSVSPETAETTTSPRTPQPYSLPTTGDAAVPPIENPAAFNGPWFASGVSNTMPVGDNFPLPSSDDNLQNGQYGLYNNRHHFTTFDLVESGPALLNKNQYLTAILGKVHVGPDHVYPWEIREESETRDVAYISDRAINVFERSKSENRPFFLTIGFIDPHRDRTRSGFGNEGPFDGRVKKIKYETSDVEIPEFLSDLPGTRQEFANYYESISRLDQGVGQILEGLKKAGLSDDTLVIFISDNGPPFINSKTTLYDAGVNLPLIVRQPGSPPSIVNPNLISWVDILPTILDYARIDAGKGSPERPGRSFLPILSTTKELADWDKVYGSHTFHEITNYWPTRYVRNRRYKYHRNLAWRLDFPFAADIYGSLTWEDIRNDEAKMVGNRPLKDYFFRPPEELYDLGNDPLEVVNLVKDSAHEKILNELRQDLEAWQRRTEDAWLYRDGISVLFVKHHLDAGMQMPDHVDFDLDKLATRGPGVKLYENKPFGSHGA
ncbi:hypothetical protein SCAR479_06704 [Seiridium cardinale]|uniref:Zn(2)-C6 fungal-type domain-containing protein n=1 Tax=Seiridium cardinale TaxID=138064 RepID=A0ABR2XS71_9PEZI